MGKLKILTEQEMLQYKKRFMKLNEYTFVNQEEDLLLDEDDDDPNDPNSLNQSNTPKDPKVNQTDNTPAISSNPEPVQPVEGDLGMESEPPAGVEPNPNIDSEIPIEDNSADNMEQPIDGGEQTELDNEVEVDVTDLTQKQGEIDNKVNNISSETSEMMGLLSTLTNKLDRIIQKTNDDMVKIKDEIVKRNPTPVEVLQKRITVSDPFTQTPADYWKQKESEGHYKLSDNDIEEQEYELKGSDINSSNSEVYKSFGLNDDEMNQSLATMFRN